MSSMALTALCAVAAALRVLPNTSQFFRYQSVSLSCEQQGDPSEWTVKRNTSTASNEECFSSWDRTQEPHCFFSDLYPSDSGVYWCESAAGDCSRAVNITVSGGPVVLESPALPVMEGDAVTLSCKGDETTSSSDLTADFYKDGLLIGSSSTGNMSLHSVSASDEGLYKCNRSAAGESPDSWLAVHADSTAAGRPEPPASPLLHILLPVAAACLSLASVVLLCLWRSHKGKRDADVSYTDVIITQEVQPQRSTDVDASSTFYSELKAGSS